MPFLSCPLAPPPSRAKLQGQTGQTMPLVSARIANAIGDHHLGLLGNGLTINFQLKQTKEMTAQALWKMSRICINIRQVSIIVSSPLHQENVNAVDNLRGALPFGAFLKKNQKYKISF